MINPKLTRIFKIVEKQAEDEGLWFLDGSASEFYLQMQLRNLHALIEDYRSEFEKFN